MLAPALQAAIYALGGLQLLYYVVYLVDVMRHLRLPSMIKYRLEFLFVLMGGVVFVTGKLLLFGLGGREGCVSYTLLYMLAIVLSFYPYLGVCYSLGHEARIRKEKPTCMPYSTESLILLSCSMGAVILTVFCLATLLSSSLHPSHSGGLLTTKAFRCVYRDANGTIYGLQFFLSLLPLVLAIFFDCRGRVNLGFSPWHKPFILIFYGVFALCEYLVQMSTLSRTVGAVFQFILSPLSFCLLLSNIITPKFLKMKRLMAPYQPIQ